jgi:hypothetical protein
MEMMWIHIPEWHYVSYLFDTRKVLGTEIMSKFCFVATLIQSPKCKDAYEGISGGMEGADEVNNFSLSFCS